LGNGREALAGQRLTTVDEGDEQHTKDEAGGSNRPQCPGERPIRDAREATDDHIFGVAGDRRRAGSTIVLKAPILGDLAGLLDFEDRNSPKGQTHQILSDNARVLLGTIYLPQGQLYVDANQPIADLSDYTIMVAGCVGGADYSFEYQL
jgi:hypothetical protein